MNAARAPVEACVTALFSSTSRSSRRAFRLRPPSMAVAIPPLACLAADCRASRSSGETWFTEASFSAPAVMTKPQNFAVQHDAAVEAVPGAERGFVPTVFTKHAEMARSGKLALSLLGLLVILTMLVQSARSPNVGPRNAGASIAWQPKRNFLILLVVILTV